LDFKNLKVMDEGVMFIHLVFLNI